jgi:hypothetical protein
MNLMMQLFISILLFSGLAWFISWGMIGILFYPKKPILGWQAPLIGWAKNIDLSNLLNEENLDAQLDKVMPVIDAKLDDFFRHRLTEKLPMISMFIGDKTIQQLKTVSCISYGFQKQGLCGFNFFFRGRYYIAFGAIGFC